MTDIAKKLDYITNSLNTVEQKLEHLETRFTCFEKRIIANETRIDKLEINQVESQKLITDLQKQTDDLKRENEQVKRRAKHQELSSELCNKSFNYLIYGIDENCLGDKRTNKKLLRKFLNEALKIPDPNAIALAGIHRLPQRPIYNKKQKKLLAQ